MPASKGQITFLKEKIEELSKKAGLRSVPQLFISKNERLAAVNPFGYRINIGETMLSLWEQGKFTEADMEATLAHEIGHLMDFRHDSQSKSFRNLLFESLWFACGITPLVLFLFSPSLLILVVTVLLALGWGYSLPWIVRRVEVGIELEADRNAAFFLVDPKQLASALAKINSFGNPPRALGFAAKLSFMRGMLTHPTFKERLTYLQALTA